MQVGHRPLVRVPLPMVMAFLALLLALLPALAGCGAQSPQTASSAPETPPAPAAEPVLPKPGCLRDAPEPPPDAQRVTVRRAVDGDTVQLADGTRVRLIGINAPESVDPRRPVQAYGREAGAFTARLLAGKTVLLQPGRTSLDRYGRTLAWLWLDDGTLVNALLVQEGYAQVYTFADNPEHAALLQTCQQEARTGGKGLWGLSKPAAP